MLRTDRQPVEYMKGMLDHVECRGWELAPILLSWALHAGNAWGNREHVVEKDQGAKHGRDYVTVLEEKTA